MTTQLEKILNISFTSCCHRSSQVPNSTSFSSWEQPENSGASGSDHEHKNSKDDVNGCQNEAERPEVSLENVTDSRTRTPRVVHAIAGHKESTNPPYPFPVS